MRSRQVDGCVWSLARGKMYASQQIDIAFGGSSCVASPIYGCSLTIPMAMREFVGLSQGSGCRVQPMIGTHMWPDRVLVYQEDFVTAKPTNSFYYTGAVRWYLSKYSHWNWLDRLPEDYFKASPTKTTNTEWKHYGILSGFIDNHWHWVSESSRTAWLQCRLSISEMSSPVRAKFGPSRGTVYIVIILVTACSYPLFPWDYIWAKCCVSRIQSDDLPLDIFVVAKALECPNLDCLGAWKVMINNWYMQCKTYFFAWRESPHYLIALD